jgi:antitoxin component HigA of HigAB toxin-antitoxin module
MDVRPIRTEADHQTALAEIAALMGSPLQTAPPGPRPRSG